MLCLRFKSEECTCSEVEFLEEDKLEEKPSERYLKISRERARRQVLDQLKYVKTCVLARELCLLIRTHRGVLEKEDVRTHCSFISKLCRDAGCEEANNLCAKAVDTVLGSEEKYLEICEQSCKKCGEARQPRRSPPERALYVA
jgi:hypothetical protein